MTLRVPLTLAITYRIFRYQQTAAQNSLISIIEYACLYECKSPIEKITIQYWYNVVCLHSTSSTIGAILKTPAVGFCILKTNGVAILKTVRPILKSIRCTPILAAQCQHCNKVDRWPNHFWFSICVGLLNLYYLQYLNNIVDLPISLGINVTQCHKKEYYKLQLVFIQEAFN